MKTSYPPLTMDMEIFETRIVPSHSMKRRGYKYKTPDELIDNKDDPEFTLPMFELNLDCSSKQFCSRIRVLARW